MHQNKTKFYFYTIVIVNHYNLLVWLLKSYEQVKIFNEGKYINMVVKKKSQTKRTGPHLLIDYVYGYDLDCRRLPEIAGAIQPTLCPLARKPFPYQLWCYAVLTRITALFYFINFFMMNIFCIWELFLNIKKK